MTCNRKYLLDSVIQSKDYPHRLDSVVQVERLEPKDYGLVAQEVKDVVPELVYTMPDSSLSISYQSLIPILIEAIKEQQIQIEKLQTTLAQFEYLIKINDFREDSRIEDVSVGKNQTINVLYQNAPNPFEEKTSIYYFLDESIKDAFVLVYDLNGRLVKRLSVCKPGLGSVEIEASELETGVYVYTLMADGLVVDTKQMILTK